MHDRSASQLQCLRLKACTESSLRGSQHICSWLVGAGTGGLDTCTDHPLPECEVHAGGSSSHARQLKSAELRL